MLGQLLRSPRHPPLLLPLLVLRLLVLLRMVLRNKRSQLVGRTRRISADLFHWRKHRSSALLRLQGMLITKVVCTIKAKLLMSVSRGRVRLTLALSRWLLVHQASRFVMNKPNLLGKRFGQRHIFTWKFLAVLRLQPQWQRSECFTCWAVFYGGCIPDGPFGYGGY